ncbi:MAG: ribonuclease P protein component [Bacilli bacterium]|nr:ribonuclease P protein component [Bacilli bacterium]
MNKKYIIKKNEEIKNIVNNSNKIVSKYFIIYYVNNQLKFNRYCISVSKKIGKAHSRNLYKRRIKDILMKNFINNNKDYVIILRNSVLNSNYIELKDELIKILKEK